MGVLQTMLRSGIPNSACTKSSCGVEDHLPGRCSIKLCSSETGSSLRKGLKGGSGWVRFSPNSFCLHGLYRDGSGNWRGKELYSASRMVFLGVATASPDALTLR